LYIYILSLFREEIFYYNQRPGESLPLIEKNKAFFLVLLSIPGRRKTIIISIGSISGSYVRETEKEDRRLIDLEASGPP